MSHNELFDYRTLSGLLFSIFFADMEQSREIPPQKHMTINTQPNYIPQTPNPIQQFQHAMRHDVGVHVQGHAKYKASLL